MFKCGSIKALRFAIAGMALLSLGACATGDEAKLHALEAKVNEALQNAAAAKIDAATALHIATEK